MPPADTAGSQTTDKPTPAEPLVFNLAKGIDLELVPVPAGSFMMGDTRGNRHEQPVHKVTISRPFYWARAWSLRQQWQCVMRQQSKYLPRPAAAGG